ncbi:MAG: hypothetical protein IPJ82_03660 [Lewinellaceae bacterium]|nr:hypothetical protein [Lewinellaceae bacterium]
MKTMIESLKWIGQYEGKDIHLLANNQSNNPLSPEVYVAETGATHYTRFNAFKTANPTATLQFSLVSLDNGIGVTLNQNTGVVTVDPTVNANVRNFIVAATVTLGAETKTLHIRFHVHRSVTSAWLSPRAGTTDFNGQQPRFFEVK